jgi:SAM-dependent methyltransferase
MPGLPEPGERFDPRVAHPARVYSYWLGGKDHYPADRDAGQEVARARPEVVTAARANRSFGHRVTGYAAAGLAIRQFLDVGAGLPAPNPTHEIAQKISPACRVVYADNDPLVLAHGRALLRAQPGAEPCTYVEADVRDPATLLEHANSLLDFTRPVAVFLLAVLHFVSDEDDPAGIIKQFAAALAPGSLIAISHLTADYAPEAIAEGAAAYNARVPVAVHPRSREELAEMCGDLKVAHPGVVPVNFWLPSLRESPGPAVDLNAAVLRLPSTNRSARTPVAERTTPTAQERAAELEQAIASFPAYEITTDLSSGRVRYIAKARTLGTHPYLIIAATLTAITKALTPDPLPEPSPTRRRAATAAARYPAHAPSHRQESPQ